MHHLIDRLTPDQLGEVRAHAVRLTTGRRRFVPWADARTTAGKLPTVDHKRFQADVDAAIDQDLLLGDHR